MSPLKTAVDAESILKEKGWGDVCEKKLHTDILNQFTSVCKDSILLDYPISVIIVVINILVAY